MNGKEKWNVYQNNYNKTHYKSVGALLNAELVENFKQKIKNDNITIADFIKDAIEKYLKSNV